MSGLTNDGGDQTPVETGERVVILIDGSSLFRAANQLNLEIDYQRLLPCLLKGRSLLRAHFYTGYSPGNLKQTAFLRWMRNNGYRVIQKELTVNSDGTRHADLGVEIAIDMLQFATSKNQVNALILVSQDADLSYALTKISNTSLQLEIVGLRSMLPSSLLNVADKFVDLESIQDKIRRKTSPEN